VRSSSIYKIPLLRITIRPFISASLPSDNFPFSLALDIQQAGAYNRSGLK
jgi:hypothetical protein